MEVGVIHGIKLSPRISEILQKAYDDFNSINVGQNKLSQASTTASRLSSDCSFTEKERTTNLINNSCQVPSGPLGIKLQITIDDETDAEAFPKCHYLWSTNRRENCLQFSPLSTFSGTSVTSSEDSGFSEENQANEKSVKLLRTKSLPSALRSSANYGKPKKVRFADAFGLDLVQKAYYDCDESPEPLSACLSFNYFNSPFASTKSPMVNRVRSVTLNPINVPQRSEAEVSHLTRSQCICLRSLYITDTTLSGVIHVLNLAYDKQVFVRYTFDDWCLFSETRAVFNYSVGNDGAVDSFNFFLSLPNDLPSPTHFRWARYANSVFGTVLTALHIGIIMLGKITDLNVQKLVGVLQSLV
ncbi:unnamed protein product [Enterobius vermicularis]|uniref:CBM21 domain-containing protein n=1 Tax=Enterobius vermicularis TaxID=51028 RepID=A0A0N4UYZ8_ENTVE|nr:unnamed protein product [Enterobius vermicularis]